MCGRLVRGGMLAGAVALAGCASELPDVSQFKLPQPRNFMPSNTGTYVPPAQVTAFKPVGSADLVDGQGLCAGMAPAAAAQGSDAGAPPPAPGAPAAPAGPAVLGAVGLDMTECDVVRAIGVPQSVNIGSNERGDRKVIMTFMGNDRSGTYEFISGRLTALERGPEPPPPKPAKPAKKKPATATKDGRKPPAT